MDSKLIRSFLLLIGICFSSQLLFSQTQFQQYQDLINNARAMGYSNEEIMMLAASQGYDQSQLQLIQGQMTGNADLAQKELDSRTRDPIEIEQVPVPEQVEELEIFGLNVFGQGSKMSFTPDINLPTPSNYKIGPGDELFIDIYGTSEKYYSVTVSPDGFVILSNIGPISVNGLTINQASRRIKSRLSRIYTGLSGQNPTTFLRVGLGSVKSITVHIIGEVNVPGTYTLSGFSSVFNALFAANGPSENGTMREVEVFRNDRLVSSVDLYEFLVTGKSDFNVRLESNDIIRVKPYLQRVLIKGGVKRPGFYEMKESETLSDLITYSGGFNETALRRIVKLERIGNDQRLVSDVFEGQYQVFELKGGDVVIVDDIIDRFENRVMIKGAVERPGNYALTPDLSMTNLIELADGLRGDALKERILVTRTNEDYSTTVIPINLTKILDGNETDIILQREDKVEILSIHDISEQPYIKISGEVVESGIFRFSEGMTIGDAIFLAKGLRNSAQGGNIEISRLNPEQNPLEQRSIIPIDLNEELKILEGGSEVSLNPFDHIIVRRNPNYFDESKITITGEVKYPGTYTILSRNEKVSDIVKRSGGLTQWAHTPSSYLIRRTEFFAERNEFADKISDLTVVQSNLDSVNSESDRLINDKISQEISNYFLSLELTNENIAAKAKKDRLDEIKRRNPLLGNIDLKRSESIALDLERILKNPGSKDDMVLEDGDILVIPKQLETIRIRGHVLYPTTVQFESRKSAKYYINKSGGFDKRAQRGFTYVVHANGEVDRTKRFLFLNTFPRVSEGAEIIVPVKPPKIPIRPSEIVGVVTGLAALLTVINQF